MQNVARVMKAVPPLRNGDHLTVAEFERRYKAMPNVKKAELIEGVVYMPSPVSFRDHGEPHNDFNGWAFVYKAFTPGVEAADNTTLRALIGSTEPQPDLCLRIIEECGGQSMVDLDGFLQGSPEWIGEVSASSASFDLNKKLRVYEKNNVLQYVVWRVEENAIDWFHLKGGNFEPMATAKDGIYKSKLFPGLWLDPKAMIVGDLIKVLDVVQQGIASPEHQRFVKKLQTRKK
jgi:Uma2 family endonuclease